MLGILIILLISGGLLFWLERDSFDAIKHHSLWTQLGQFLAGFVFFFLFHLMMQGLDTIVQSIEWKRNPDLAYFMVLNSFWYHLKSAITEDLIFRGALLYILIKRLGLQTGLIISAAAFGVYHWFSYGVWGSLVPMIYVFIVTASMGYVWAWVFARTRSIMLGLGLHLGWNFLGALFSSGPNGKLLFIEQARVGLEEWINLWYLLATGIAVPLITILLLSYFWPRQKLIPIVKEEDSQ